MDPISYDIAVSIDQFICGRGGDISHFAREGKVVEDYTASLENYATAIIGRATYEFGYRFGMQPGQNPYPQMKTIIFRPRSNCRMLQTSQCNRVATMHLSTRYNATQPAQSTSLAAASSQDRFWP